MSPFATSASASLPQPHPHAQGPAAGLSQASLDPVLSPALEINPFADAVASFNMPTARQDQNAGSAAVAGKNDHQQVAASSGGNDASGGPDNINSIDGSAQ